MRESEEMRGRAREREGEGARFRNIDKRVRKCDEERVRLKSVRNSKGEGAKLKKSEEERGTAREMERDRERVRVSIRGVNNPSVKI